MVFGLIIPNNTLKVLAKWFGDTPIIALQGGSVGAAGQAPSMPLTIGDVQYGNRRAQTVIRAELGLDVSARGVNSALTLPQILDSLNAAGIPNATITSMTYHINLHEGEWLPYKDNYVWLTLKRITPHKALDEERIVDGDGIPNSQLYQMMNSMKQGMDRRDAAKYRSSYLFMSNIFPSPAKFLLDDPKFINTIKKHYMHAYQGNLKNYTMKDMDFKRAGRPKQEG